MGRKAVGPVCCVMHVKEPRTLIVKEKGLAPLFLEWQQNAPKLFAPRNRFSLDRWRNINALYYYYINLPSCLGGFFRVDSASNIESIVKCIHMNGMLLFSHLCV